MICPTQLQATPQSLEALTNSCIPSNFFGFLASVQLLNGSLFHAFREQRKKGKKLVKEASGHFSKKAFPPILDC